MRSNAVEAIYFRNSKNVRPRRTSSNRLQSATAAMTRGLVTCACCAVFVGQVVRPRSMLPSSALSGDSTIPGGPGNTLPMPSHTIPCISDAHHTLSAEAVIPC